MRTGLGEEERTIVVTPNHLGQVETEDAGLWYKMAVNLFWCWKNTKLVWICDCVSYLLVGKCRKGRDVGGVGEFEKK